MIVNRGARNFLYDFAFFIEKQPISAGLPYGVVLALDVGHSVGVPSEVFTDLYAMYVMVLRPTGSIRIKRIPFAVRLSVLPFAAFGKLAFFIEEGQTHRVSLYNACLTLHIAVGPPICDHGLWVATYHSQENESDANGMGLDSHCLIQQLVRPLSFSMDGKLD